MKDLLSLPRSAGSPPPARARFLETVEDTDFWHTQLEVSSLFDGIFAGSPYLSRLLHHTPQTARAFLENGPESTLAAILSETRACMDKEENRNGAMHHLRAMKNRAALTIALADLAGEWNLDKVCSALSDTAETAINAALSFLLSRAARRGKLTLSDPQAPRTACGVIVLAVGKLGSRELNYSSDIDLILLYDPDVVPWTGGPHDLGPFMVRLARDLVALLQERTKDGYVFRTDLRLRPDPGATQIILPVGAAETYYESFGQNWERAAMIRARPVAGDMAAGESFVSTLRPFVWRRSLDLQAIADIQSIKRQIGAFHATGNEEELAGYNLKLGAGGIREIEFFAQTQQLIWGGRTPPLRKRAVRPALDALAEAGHIPAKTAGEMKTAYAFLRQIEHRLQMTNDEQTQEIPQDREKQTRLARFAGFETAEALHTALTSHRRTVRNHYDALFAEAPSLSGPGSLVFTGTGDDPDTLHTLSNMGYTDPPMVAGTIRGWHHGRYRAMRSTRAREIMTDLVPGLLEAFGNAPHPDAAFLRFDRFLGNVPAGAPVLSLLAAHPPLLNLIAEIMADAPRLADYLGRRPSLLEHVLAPDFFDPLPGASKLRAELDARLDHAEDYEDVLNVVRRWAKDRSFQVGVQILRGHLSGVESGEKLTDLTDVGLAALMPRVETEFAARHGRIPGGGLSLIALGRVGSREMSAHSDLDLLFVYDVPPDTQESRGGTRNLAPSAYYTRLVQRFISALTTPTPEGRLWEVDMRLRPSGTAGPVAVSREAFARYHGEDAWTWEHMALTRARVISGPPALCENVRTIIRETLQRPRDLAALKKDAAEMRQRIANTHGRGQSPWDIKHRPGGLVDISFAVQVLVLAHGASHPEVLTPVTTKAIEGLCTAGLISRKQAETLQKATRLWLSLKALLSQTMEEDADEKDLPPGLKRRICALLETETFEEARRRADATGDKAHSVCEQIFKTPFPPS